MSADDADDCYCPACHASRMRKRALAERDDMSPERLRARREALGWTVEQAARAAGLADCDIVDLETHAPEYALAPWRDRYAAALTAEEQRRAQQPPPAPEVVDVPQRLVHDTSPTWLVCGNVEANWYQGQVSVRLDVDDGSHVVRVPVALVLAMADAIRARGAS